MNKKQLYLSLIFLMCKLEDAKDNLSCDKTFIIALTEVLCYFRDNGELKEAFKQQKSILENIKNQYLCKSILDKFCEDTNIEIQSFDKIAEKLSSDEYIENKIKKVLGCAQY